MDMNILFNTIYVIVGILVGLVCITGTIWGAVVYTKARQFGRQQIVLTTTVVLIIVLLISSITAFFVYPRAKEIIQGIKEYSPTSALAPTATVLPTLTPKSTVTPTSGNIFYVSKNGNNGDGLSWQTAWNELNQINWSRIQPGDTILLDGSSTRMVYTTTLTIGKSGTATAPIRIERAAETGRNGKVEIFGGRSIPLPYCGQTNYAYQTSSITTHGIVFGGHAWIIVDGMSWDGIRIYGHSSHGIDMTNNPSKDIVRNIEIYDNGYASQNGSSWLPETDGHGVYLNGSNLIFEYLDIHDNSDDEFDTGVGSINNLIIRHSWLHVSREDPNNSGLPFNQCVHQDGYQIYSGGTQGGILIEDSVVGPGLKEGLILGAPYQGQWGGATVNNVTIRNSLFTNKVINIMGFPRIRESNWIIDHVTVITPGSGQAESQSLFLEGSNLTVTNSIFYGGQIYLPDGLATSMNNCQWRTVGHTSSIIGQTIDPRFVTDVSAFSASTPLAQIANASFALRSDSPCAGRGSSITSVVQLIHSSTSF
jgi:hypothetical protein